MSTRAFTKVKTPYDASGVFIIKWSGLLNGDDGEPLPCPHYADKCVQVIGTFGVGGNVKIEGAHDPDSPTYATLNDAQGNGLDVTLAKMEQVLENTYLIRPRVTAGDGTTDITVYLLTGTSR